MLLVAACGSSGDGSAPNGGGASSKIDIGLLAALTGPTANNQVGWVHGIQAYFKALNDGGGIHGAKVNLIVKDDKYDAQTCISLYKSFLTTTKVTALIGLNSSDCQQALAPSLARNKLPVIGPQVTTRAALDPFNKYFFSVQCDKSEMADVSYAYYQKTLNLNGPVKVVSTASAIASSDDWNRQMKKHVGDSGGTLTSAPIAITAVDATSQAHTIATNKPNFVTFAGTSDNALSVLKSMHAAGLTEPLGADFATGVPAVFNSVPQSVGKQVSWVDCYTAPYVAKNSELNAAANKYGYSKDLVDRSFSQGWVTAEAVATGLKNAGKDLSSDGVVKGMESVNIEDTGGLSGPVKFSATTRQGISQVRPFVWDYAADKPKPVGTYQQWSTAITHAFEPKG